LLRSAHSSVETPSDSRIKTPPIVGVPFLVSAWRSGVSSRIGGSGCLDLSQPMMRSPNRNEISKAVITAPPERNVR